MLASQSRPTLRPPKEAKASSVAAILLVAADVVALDAVVAPAVVVVVHARARAKRVLPTVRRLLRQPPTVPRLMRQPKLLL